MNRLIATFWIQFEDSRISIASRTADIVELLLQMRPDNQSRRVDISASMTKTPVRQPIATERVSRLAAVDTVRSIDDNHLTRLRVSCGLAGKDGAFHNEAWSAEFTSGSVFDSRRDEYCVCMDIRSLLGRRVKLDPFLVMLDAIIKNDDIVSGVCDVGKWRETIGGEYYLQTPWHGFDRNRSVRRSMWNEGGRTAKWVRDLGWLTIVGTPLCAGIPAWDGICDRYNLGPDSVTSIRRQVALRKTYGTVFVAAHDPMFYFEQPSDECNLLNGWLGINLRLHGVLM